MYAFKLNFCKMRQRIARFCRGPSCEIELYHRPGHGRQDEAAVRRHLNPVSTGGAGICVPMSRATQGPLGFRPGDVSSRYIPKFCGLSRGNPRTTAPPADSRFRARQSQYAHIYELSPLVSGGALGKCNLDKESWSGPRRRRGRTSLALEAN